MRFIRLYLVISLLALAGSVAAQTQGRAVFNEPAILSEYDRIEPENRMVADRLENLLPTLMEETGIELWLVMNREYAEDPVYFTLVPQPSFAARRTTMLLFHLQEDGTVDRLSVNRYPLGEPYQVGWDGGNLDAQWAALGDILAERDPETIGINTSSTWPEADGLTHGLHRKTTRRPARRLRGPDRFSRGPGRSLDGNALGSGAGGLPPRSLDCPPRHCRGLLEPHDHARRHHH